MKRILLLIFVVFGLQRIEAQEFDAQLQIRPRFEFRNGYRTLLSDESQATEFISQRSRLNLNYAFEDFRLSFSMQNARVWGDEPINTSSGNNSIGIFEAYAEYFLNENLSIRMGRQVISYDNERVLGAADWGQAGKAHDALRMVWLPAENHHLEVAAALSNDAEHIVEDPYFVNLYKNMQLAWYHIGFTNSGLSFLALNTGFEVNDFNSGRETQYQQTFGAYFDFKKSNWSGDLYGNIQTGERNHQNLSAWNAGANLSYRLNNKFSAGFGSEYLSGTDMDQIGGSNHSFTPLFGTNHRHNGHMDYFYVGNHQNSVGLMDFFGRLTYEHNNFNISLMPHIFHSAAKVVNFQDEKMDSYLGTEIDLAGSYNLRKNLSIGFGYAQMFASNTMEVLKGGDASKLQNWAWLAISFHPNIFSWKKVEVTE